MAERVVKEKLSPQERMYKEACELQECIGCIVKFERKVAALRSAAVKFEKLGDYLDSKERRDACLEKAEDIDIKESKIVFELAEEKKKKSKNKSDYFDTIYEYKRVVRKDEYKEQAEAGIEECTCRINQLEKKAVRVRRLIALAMIAVLMFGVSRTPVYPMAKGFVHLQMGNYEKAFVNYKLAKGVPGTKSGLASCYLHFGDAHMKKGKTMKALKDYMRGNRNEEAAEKQLKIEKSIWKDVEAGDIVPFGRIKWVVLEKQGDKMLLLAKNTHKKVEYSVEENTSWDESNVRKIINSTFIKKMLSKAEVEIIEQQRMKLSIEKQNKYYSGNIYSLKSLDGLREFLFELSSEEYEKYISIIPSVEKNWWLRGDKKVAEDAKCITPLGTVATVSQQADDCYIRPAVWVKFK